MRKHLTAFSSSWLSVFHHFVGLALKSLKSLNLDVPKHAFPVVTLCRFNVYGTSYNVTDVALDIL